MTSLFFLVWQYLTPLYSDAEFQNISDNLTIVPKFINKDLNEKFSHKME